MNKFKINENGYWESTDNSGHCFDVNLCSAIKNLVKDKSLLDLGCGTGAYTKELATVCSTAIGYDGNPNTKKISNGLCDVADLTQLHNFKKVDWVVCLEVGEHIPKKFEDVLFKNICNHATDGVVLSWAIPNQPGDGHINCQSNEYVINKMLSFGYKFDKGTSAVLRNAADLWWFKNTLMCFKKIQMPKITFCIPSKNNLRYLKACLPSIRKNSYRNDHDIIVFVDKDTDGTVDWLNSVQSEYNVKYIANPNMNNTLFGIGKAYDACIEKSETDIFMIFHADMMLGKYADFEAFKYLDKNKVVCATRIEPPLHPEGPEKIVRDFGLWPEENIQDGFKEAEFDSFIENCKNENQGKITNGCFAPWMMYKEDFKKIGMHDPIMKSAREDSDVFNRMVLNGYDLIQSWTSFVYHLTCRGGQFEHGVLTKDHSQKSKDWQILMHYSTLEFIRKWGSPVLHDEFLNPIVKNKYNIGFVAKNCNLELLSYLEPWCNNIYTDCPEQERYKTDTQPHTSFAISKRVCNINDVKTNDVLVEFDASAMTQERFAFLTSQLSDVLTDSGEIGEFEYDIFKIKIKSLQTYHRDLIICK